MKRWQGEFPVPLMCRVLSTTPSGYYAWLARPVSRRQQEDARLAVEIRAVHKRTRETYGPERLQQELASDGIKASVYKVKRIRRDLGLRCKQKKKFKATTNSRHNLPVAENLLQQQRSGSEKSDTPLSGKSATSKAL